MFFRALFDSYQAHLVSHPTENEFFGLLGDSEVDTIQLENVAGAIETEDPRTVGPKKPGRKRKEPVTPDESAIQTPVKRSSRLLEKENVPPQPPQPQTEAEQDAVFNNVLATSQQQQQPQTQPQQPPPETPRQPEIENMGYDPNSSTQLSNLGYDQGAPTPGAPSMGAATPYRYVTVDFVLTMDLSIRRFCRF